MKPGEIITLNGSITLNEGREGCSIMVSNTGDRPIQVGSHYHFFETNEALSFDRESARGMRLDIASGTAVPLIWPAKSITVVVPPQAAAWVPVSKVSLDVAWSDIGS